MKKLIAIFATVAMVASQQLADAAALAADTVELRLQGTLDPTSANGDVFSLAGSYGYFFIDNVQAGGRVHIKSDDLVRDIGVGAFIEGNVDTGSELVPFAEAYLGLSNVDVDKIGDSTALLIEIRVGAKYFIADHVAIAAAGVFAYATDEIYVDNSKLRDTDSFLELSLRCYY